MAENILNYGKRISYMGCYQSKPLFTIMMVACSFGSSSEKLSTGNVSTN